eukprot:scaffold92482_cov54-Phaeocystis_antarctica.AAC.3
MSGSRRLPKARRLRHVSGRPAWSAVACGLRSEVCGSAVRALRGGALHGVVGEGVDAVGGGQRGRQRGERGHAAHDAAGARHHHRRRAVQHEQRQGRVAHEDTKRGGRKQRPPHKDSRSEAPRRDTR